MAGPATRSITLDVQMQNHYSLNVIDGFRIFGTITAVDSFPSTKLFRYERIPPTTPGGPIETDMFNGVCSPVDLQEFPEDDPFPNANPPYFRLDFFDLVFRTRELAMEAYEAILDDLGRLIRSQNAMDILGPPSTVIVGPFPP